MTPQQVQDVAVSAAALQGWNPGIDDAACFYAQDPNGFFLAKLGDETIGCASAVIYDASFAFFGFYIIEEAFRARGYGMQLTKHRLAYAGDRNIGLDGVIDMCDKYANIGFKPAHANHRYQGQFIKQFHSSSNIMQIDDKCVPGIFAYDKRYFPVPRPAFLSHWLHLPHGCALAYIVDGEIGGYGVIRQCQQGFKIGPLFAETFEAASALFENLVNYAEGVRVYLDIPEPNGHMNKFVKQYELNVCFDVLRMYTKKPPLINLNNVYGITSFELG